MKRGRPVNPIRQAYSTRYDIPYERIRRVPLRQLERLIGCQSPEAVRLILLGIMKEKKPCPKRNARANISRSMTTV